MFIQGEPLKLLRNSARMRATSGCDFQSPYLQDHQLHHYCAMCRTWHASNFPYLCHPQSRPSTVPGSTISVRDSNIRHRHVGDALLTLAGIFKPGTLFTTNLVQQLACKVAPPGFMQWCARHFERAAHDQIDLEGGRNNLAAMVRHDRGRAAAAEHIGRAGIL